MSAHKVTDCRIDCDEPGCGACEFAGSIAMTPDLTAAAARKVLKARGWQVGRSDGHGTRQDFCPEHATGRLPAFLAAVLSVACPRCGVGQNEECVNPKGDRRYRASESHSGRVEMAKRLDVPRED